MLSTTASISQSGWKRSICCAYSGKKLPVYSPVSGSVSADWISCLRSDSSMMRPTRARMTSCMSKGLVMKSAAPSCRLRSSALFSAVSTMTGRSRSVPSSRRRVSTSKPSITGIIRSSRTIESMSRCARICSSACCPFSAKIRSYSSHRIISSSERLIS